MKIGSESCHHSELSKVSSPPPPPPLPPLPRISVSAKQDVKQECVASVTKQEIATYWRKKHEIEEDHLFAAIKAAARIRARYLWENNYHPLEESLTDCDDNTETDKRAKISNQKEEYMEEIRVGIKDWWTKSKYAYLNQPAIKSVEVDTPKRRVSCYTPQFHCYKTTSTPVSITFGIF